MGPGRIYHREAFKDHPAFKLARPSPELQAKMDKAEWPADLVDRLMAVRVDHVTIHEWLDSGFPDAENLAKWADREERLINTTLVCRQATWADDDLLSDLCANSPETLGDWTVTVERGPNPYAQFRLQEHPNVQVLEDRRVGLGMTANSVRNTLIAGERTTANFMSGWRVRDGFRGLGLSKLLQNSGGPGVSWFGLVSYWYVRKGNASQAWVAKISSDLADRPEGYSTETETLSATVTHLPSNPEANASPRVRKATEQDLGPCVELINRTHQGLDLFRPYTVDFLWERLNDPSWGEEPPFIASIYGWEDFAVIEDNGQIVACGGMWDRGRDVREVWRHDQTDESHLVDPTAILDFGFAEGHVEAGAQLLGHFLARSTKLGRSSMMVALEFLPDLAEACVSLAPTTESRELHAMPFTYPGFTVNATITRPYTDLAYW